MSDSSDFKLGEWWIRPQRNQLERADACAQIESRSMGVLVCLALHAPEVVSKERLLEEVWSDSPFVGDDVISHAIWELRKALGDSARAPAYIRTVPRKGYRLVAEVLRPQGSPLPLEGCRIDHYDLGREIGRGAMGVVFEAVDRRLSRPVAIKFLAEELTRDPKACQRFEREARLAASLDHPNLATVHEVGETSQGYRYLVTAHYGGGSLKDRLAEGPLAWRDAMGYVRQLVAGLGAAHERGIVHRDIKPANLLIDDHGTLKICDFGIAKLLGGTDLTRTGTPLGTPAYKSPEQSRGFEVDHRTDLWSVGVVFYELLTGRRPFEGGYEQAVVHSIIAEEPRPLAPSGSEAIPEAVESFIARALAKDPAERFQSAAEMVAALDGLEESPPPDSNWSAGKHHQLMGAGLMVLLGLAGSAFWWGRDRPGEPTLEANAGLFGGAAPTARIDAGERDGLTHLAEARRHWLSGNDPGTIRRVKRHLEKAVELLPDSAEAKGHLAVFLAEQYARWKREKDAERALTLAQSAVILDPTSSLPLVAEAWVFIMSQQVEKGEALARRAIQMQPDCDRDQICHLGYVVSAEAAWMGDRARESYAILQQCTGVGGGYIRCRLKLAQLYSKSSGLKREAEQLLLDVLEFDEEQTTALHELGNLYLEQWRPEDAIDYLELNYELTKDPTVLISVGYAQFQRRLWDVAIETYRRAHSELMAAGRPSATPLMAIGDVYLEQGKKSESQRHYAEALLIYDAVAKPGATLKGRRAVCLAKLGRLAEAVAEIESILPERKQGSPTLLVYAARIYALKGDRERLFAVAHEWIERDGGAIKLLDEDPAFLPYRQDAEYLRIVQPGLMPDP